MRAQEVERLASTLLEARVNRRVADRPSHSGYSLSVDDGYDVQRGQLALLEKQGEKPLAIKLGLTDQVQRDAASWQQPSFGTLTDQMVLQPGEPLVLADGIAPRVEPEIVVTLAHDVTSVPGSRDELLDAIAGIHLGIEVVDPRFDDGAFILTDALADNAGAFRGVWSEYSLEPRDIDLVTLELTLAVNGEVVLRGQGVNLMGDPLVNVQEVLVERLRLGFPNPRGLAIFTGNIAGRAHPVVGGDVVSVAGDGLGELSLRVV